MVFSYWEKHFSYWKKIGRVQIRASDCEYLNANSSLKSGILRQSDYYFSKNSPSLVGKKFMKNWGNSPLKVEFRNSIPWFIWNGEDAINYTDYAGLPLPSIGMWYGKAGISAIYTWKRWKFFGDFYILRNYLHCKTTSW